MDIVVRCGSCGGVLRTLRTQTVYGEKPEEQVFVNACVACTDRKYQEGVADGRLEEREKNESDPEGVPEELDLTVKPLGVDSQ